VSSALRGIVFDLDGTIAETFPMAIDLVGRTIERHGGGTLTAEEVIAYFGPTEQGILRAALGEGWEAAWEDYLAAYVPAHRMCPRPFPGMTEAIREAHARGCRIGLVTGKTATTGALSLEVFGIADLFDGVEGGAMDEIVKAERIATLLGAWHLRPDAAAYVGDVPGDVREARTAGVAAVAAAWSAFADRDALAAEQPDLLFDDVASFAEWLDGAACPG